LAPGSVLTGAENLAPTGIRSPESRYIDGATNPYTFVMHKAIYFHGCFAPRQNILYAVIHDEICLLLTNRPIFDHGAKVPLDFFLLLNFNLMSVTNKAMSLLTIHTRMFYVGSCNAPVLFILFTQ
jgi:hypothetical protein